jgi:hypothetical protein
MDRRSFLRNISAGAAGAAAGAIVPFRAVAAGLKHRERTEPSGEASQPGLYQRFYDVSDRIPADDPLLTVSEIPDQVFVNGLMQREGRDMDYWLDPADPGPGYVVHLTTDLRPGDWIGLTYIT